MDLLKIEEQIVKKFHELTCKLQCTKDVLEQDSDELAALKSLHSCVETLTEISQLIFDAAVAPEAEQQRYADIAGRVEHYHSAEGFDDESAT
jgi:hypothetical protein